MASRPMAQSTPTVPQTAREAVIRGWTPLPLTDHTKRPTSPAWQRTTWEGKSLDEVEEEFTEATARGAGNIGLLLGRASGGLVDVDLDHPLTNRIKDFFLPPTHMRHGRPGRPSSHFWYIAEEGTIPASRTHLLPRKPDGKVGDTLIELRSTDHQTVIPPSTHPSGEEYIWMGEPFGGELGPATVDGRVLTLQVALIGLTANLLHHWPEEGGRHEAYLALAGGLLRYGSGVHPYWARNIEVLVRAIASATDDEDGIDERVREVVPTTIRRLESGRTAAGFPKLAEILGESDVEQVRRMVHEVESAAGFRPDIVATSSTAPVASKAPGPSSPTRTAQKSGSVDDSDDSGTLRGDDEVEGPIEEIRESEDPLDNRVTTWEPVNLEPYIDGQVRMAEPEVLHRSDGQALMYRGRVNMLYGSSESAKSWVALHTALQEIEVGERVMYLDFEDEPVQTLNRMKLMGARDDDLRTLFAYVHPEEPLAPMQRNRWGMEASTEAGKRNHEAFQAAVESIDPALIIADGMTVLYGLHGLDSNDAVSTEIITSWLKHLTRNGRSTVVVIDHTTKNAEKGALPLGSQHKVAMVQGTMLQVYPVQQPVPGAIGTIDLVVLKDRPGAVRAISSTPGSKAQVCARITMDSTAPGVVDMTIGVPPYSPPAAPGEVVVDGESDGRGHRRKKPSKAAEQLDAARARDAKRLADQERQKILDDAVLLAWGGDLDLAMGAKEVAAALAATRGAPISDPEGEDFSKIRQTLYGLRDRGVLDQTGKTKGAKYTLVIAPVED